MRKKSNGSEMRANTLSHPFRLSCRNLRPIYVYRLLNIYVYTVYIAQKAVIAITLVIKEHNQSCTA